MCHEEGSHKCEELGLWQLMLGIVICCQGTVNFLTEAGLASWMKIYPEHETLGRKADVQGHQ